MKSLLVSGTYFPPGVGGISHFMASLCRELGRQHVCCLTGVPDDGTEAVNLGDFHVYRRPLAFAAQKALQAPGFAAAVAEIMLRERPEFVQLATVGDCFIGLWLKRWFNLPFNIIAHGNEILAVERPGWVKPRQALEQAGRVIAVSRFTAQVLEQRLGIAPERIVIMHPGCDLDVFRPLEPRQELRHRILGERRDAKIILTVGWLVARKGHDMILRSLPRVLDRVPNAVYLVVGDGPYRPELERLTASLGLTDRVVFMGRASSADLPELYAMCDVFAMPSRARLEQDDVEGFGMVFIEANACGKPVIGGRSGGIGDAIVDGETGLLVAPEDPADIGAALVRLLLDPALANRLGARGRARARSEFSWRRFAQQLQDLSETVRRESASRARGA